MIEIGSRVEIEKVGSIYSDYKEWADVHGLKGWVQGYSPKKGRTGTVVSRGFHENGRVILLGVEIDNYVPVIIAESGVTKIVENPVFKSGDDVEVSDDDENYIKAVFIGEYKGLYYARSYIRDSNDLYNSVVDWRCCRFPIIKTREVTTQVPEGYEIKLQKIE